MASFECYEQVMAAEQKRWTQALTEAQVIIMSEISEHKPEGFDMGKVGAAHVTTSLLSETLWSDYLMEFGELIEPCKVVRSIPLKIKERPRTKFATYAASLRALVGSVNHSYLLKAVLSHYNLGNLVEKFGGTIAKGLVFLRQAEAVAEWMQTYMTWIEIGASESYRFYQGSPDNDLEAKVSDFYDDVRVRTYAVLKSIELKPERLELFLNDLVGLIEAAIDLLSSKEDIYSSLENKDFENIFHALTSKKEKAPDYEGTKYQNVHELNEYVRECVKESTESDDGKRKSMIRLLRATEELYLDKLTNELVDLLAFLPSHRTQEEYIRKFEKGDLWKE